MILGRRKLMGLNVHDQFPWSPSTSKRNLCFLNAPLQAVGSGAGRATDVPDYLLVSEQIAQVIDHFRMSRSCLCQAQVLMYQRPVQGTCKQIRPCQHKAKHPVPKAKRFSITSARKGFCAETLVASSLVTNRHNSLPQHVCPTNSSMHAQPQLFYFFILNRTH